MSVDYRQGLISMGVPASTVDKFLSYHRSNPAVWGRFEELALSKATAGAKRIGAKAVAERVREDFRIEIHNSWVAYYARAFAIKHPQFSHLFSFNDLKGVRGNYGDV